MPLHVVGENVAAVSAAGHAAPSAGMNVNAQGRGLVSMERAKGRSPCARADQFHFFDIDEVGQWCREQGTIEGKAGLLKSPARVRVSHVMPRGYV